MCFPQAGLLLQGAGAVNSAVGSFYAAQSQRDALRTSAGLKEQQAQQALLSGQREEQRARLATANLKSRQRVALASGGVDLGAGTAADLLTGTDLMGEADAMTIRTNAVRSAWGYRTDAAMQNAAADAVSPVGAAFSTLMGKAGQVAESWYRFKKDGGFDALPSNGDGKSQGDRRQLGVW